MSRRDEPGRMGRPSREQRCSLITVADANCCLPVDEQELAA
jgi:hypothetical protein